MWDEGEEGVMENLDGGGAAQLSNFTLCFLSTLDVVSAAAQTSSAIIRRLIAWSLCLPRRACALGAGWGWERCHLACERDDEDDKKRLYRIRCSVARG